jgi:hypothetical protein
MENGLPSFERSASRGKKRKELNSTYASPLKIRKKVSEPSSILKALLKEQGISELYEEIKAVNDFQLDC